MVDLILFFSGWVYSSSSSCSFLIVALGLALDFRFHYLRQRSCPRDLGVNFGYLVPLAKFFDHRATSQYPVSVSWKSSFPAGVDYSLENFGHHGLGPHN